MLVSSAIRSAIVPVIIAFFLCTNELQAADANLSFIVEDHKNPLRLTLVIDEAKKIAGMKAVITFNQNNLVLKHAEKSKDTASFLHVVNDKVPGRVVFVMASATGVSGKNLALCHFEFSNIENSQENSSRISITHLELMNENLRKIKGNRPFFEIKTKRPENIN